MPKLFSALTMLQPSCKGMAILRVTDGWMTRVVAEDQQLFLQIHWQWNLMHWLSHNWLICSLGNVWWWHFTHDTSSIWVGEKKKKKNLCCSFQLPVIILLLGQQCWPHLDLDSISCPYSFFFSTKQLLPHSLKLCCEVSELSQTQIPSLTLAQSLSPREKLYPPVVAKSYPERWVLPRSY